MKQMWAKLQLPVKFRGDLTARVTNIFILALLGVLIPVGLAQFLFLETELSVHVSNLILLISFIFLLWLLRAGRVTLAAALCVVFTGAIMVLANVTNVRPLTTVNMMGLSLIICSALALNRKGLILSTLVSFAAITIGLVVWETRSLSTVQQRDLVQNFIGYAVQFGFAAFVSYTMIGQMRSANIHIEQTDRQLIERNVILEREIAERQRAEQREQHKSALMRAAMDATNELVGLDNIDELWRRAIELARERLGIERCIVFVRNEQTGQVWGTFGTDVNGKTTDERAFYSQEMTDFWKSDLKAQWVADPWVAIPHRKHMQLAADGSNDEQVGEGWVVYTSIATHEGVPFAVMCNDTAISGTSLDKGQQDALAVYCSLVGHLAERKLLEGKVRQQAAHQAMLSERNRLARDLHDSVSQALFGVVMGATTARQMLTVAPEKLAQPLDYVLQMSQAALSELRALIFELRPESLEQDGLIVALSKQASSLLLRHKIAVEMDMGSVEPSINFTTKEALYRIGIESLQNSIKHAQATKVHMVLRVLPNETWLELSDNGIGFDVSANYPGHLGLVSMRERAEGFGGSLKIRSTPGGGTAVRVTLPLQSNRIDRGQWSGTMSGLHEPGNIAARREFSSGI